MSAKDPVGAAYGDRQLWAQEQAATRAGRWAPGPYSCAELLAFLAANPERESALLRAFINSQLMVGSCPKP